jgi:dinuclear metal center YbgI/SA1388 family protein
VAAHTLADVLAVADTLWPPDGAEGWDASGLVSGRLGASVDRILLAVDPVRATVDEALRGHAQLLITHHPLLLRGVTSIAEDRYKGALLGDLVRADCALFAAHTTADVVDDGTSAVLARRLGLTDLAPIEPGARPGSGLGRVGILAEAMSLREFAARLAHLLPITVGGVRVAGDPDRPVRRIAVCGGAGDSLLSHPAVRGADAYVTADLRHHPASEAVEQTASVGRGPALLDVSHWASEHVWLEEAAAGLRAALPGVVVTVSGTRTEAWTFSMGADSEPDRTVPGGLDAVPRKDDA